MADFAKKSECTGCSACEAACPLNCIQMIEDQYGFPYPKLSDPGKCIECNKCSRVCPVNSSGKSQIIKNRAYACFNTNSNERAESSSGGVFSLLARQIIANGGVVFGASYDDNFAVRHVGISATNDIRKLRGAKYAQSTLRGVFDQIGKLLNGGQTVLFSGTPCQVAGLKSYLGGDQKNLFTVDFICHGVPSPLVWNRYIQYRAGIDSEGKIPCHINMRSKNTGWSLYKYSCLFEYSNSKAYSAYSSDDLFMKLFVGDYINRESCASCKFKGYDRASDITLGDFWGIWDIYPELDDDKGISAVLTHSEKGENLIKRCGIKLTYKQVELNQVSRQNLALVESYRPPDNRKIVLKYGRDGRFKEIEEILAVADEKNSFLIKLKRKILG